MALVRYYVYFDNGQKIYSFFKEKITKDEIIIIDEVLNECKVTSKGLVVSKFDFFDDKAFQKEYKFPIKTTNMIAPAPKKILNQVENNFTTPRAKTLKSAQFEKIKSDFLNSADMRMIIYTLNRIHKKKSLDIRIVTEETGFANDKKAFKKIPAICKHLKIKCQALPELLNEYQGIDFKIE